VEKKLRELIKKFLQEYMGTGSSGGNATDGNDIISPRPFADDKDEIENYTYKSIYGGDGGHYKNEPAFANPNRQKMGMFEQSSESARKRKTAARLNAEADLDDLIDQRDDAVAAAGEGKGEATKAISQQETQLAETNKKIAKLKQEYTKENTLYKQLNQRFKEMPIDTDEALEAKTEVYDQIVELRGKIQGVYEEIKDVRKQRNEMSKGIQQAVSAQTSQPSATKQFDQQIRDARKALANAGKSQVQEQAYGHATLTTQGHHNSRAIVPTDEYPFSARPKSRLPGIMEEDEPIDPDYQGPSYDEVYLKNKLVGFKDAYEYDKGEIIIYPDLGSLQYKSRSTQEIVFKLIEGDLHFVRAFGMTRSYDELKKVLPELGQMGGSSYSGFMNVGVDNQPISLAKYGISGIEIAHDMIQALNIGREGESAAQSKHYGAIRTPGTGGTGIEETLLHQYEKERNNVNLMEQMDMYKETTRGSLQKFFEMFEAGKTNEEVIQHYAKNGIQIPEQFISKVKKQFESYKKLKLELGFSEQEAKDMKKSVVLKEKPKQLSKKIFKK